MPGQGRNYCEENDVFSREISGDSVGVIKTMIYTGIVLVLYYCVLSLCHTDSTVEATLYHTGGLYKGNK